VKLVQQVFTREKSGILEKYYRAVARDISIPSSLLRGAPRDEILAAMTQFAWSAFAGYMRTASYIAQQPEAEMDKYTVGMSGATLWMTREESRQFGADLQKLLDIYSTHRGVEGEQEMTFFTILYPAQLGFQPEPAPPVAEPRTNERPADQP